MSPNAVPAEDKEHIRRLPVQLLLLDPLNPRIVVAPGADQFEITRVLYETQALDELAFSFQRSGFFLEEPVVIVPADSTPEHFIVVEGNRRIATIKILLDEGLRKKF